MAYFFGPPCGLNNCIQGIGNGIYTMQSVTQRLFINSLIRSSYQKNVSALKRQPNARHQWWLKREVRIQLEPRPHVHTLWLYHRMWT